MKKTSVKAGYRISCNSWENDGDNYNLTIKDGFSEPYARFIYDILSQFFMDSDISNLYEPNEDEIEEFNDTMYAVFNRHACAAEYFLIEDSSKYSAEQIVDRITTILHNFMGSSEYFTRVVEEIKVEYIPEDVIFEDRSENFKHVQKTFTNYR